MKNILDAIGWNVEKTVNLELFWIMDFLKEIVKEIGDEYTQLASDIDSETETYVDTGSYIFNGLVSGSRFGGESGNKITIAGESSTGKTFFSLACRQELP